MNLGTGLLVLGLLIVFGFSSFAGWLVYGAVEASFPGNGWSVRIGIAAGLGASIAVALIFFKVTSGRR